MARYNHAFDGERRTELIALKATPSEKSDLEAAARLQGATKSTYARELLFRRSASVVAATRRNPEAAAILAQLDSLSEHASRIGNNLNQIAHQLNATGELRYAERLDLALEEHDRLAGLIRQAVERVISL